MSPTLKQKRLAKVVLENAGTPGITKGALVEMGGYGKVVQDTPSKALESKGFKQALAEYGLTEELITTALVEDIKAKPRARVKELGLGAEILGMKKQDGGGNTNNLIIIGGDQAERIARRAITRISGGSQLPDRLHDSDESQIPT